VKDGDCSSRSTCGLRGERSRGGLVRAASRIDRSWLVPTRRSIEHAFDPDSGAVRAVERSWYGALPLSERAVPPDPVEAARLLAQAVRSLGLGEDARAILNRAVSAGIPLEPDEWIASACRERSDLGQVDSPRPSPGRLAELDRLAPEALPVPSDVARA